jgi:hypothetical protein
MSQVLHSNFGKFIKDDMDPSDFNDKLDQYYTTLSNDEHETLNNDYTKFYNDKLENHVSSIRLSALIMKRKKAVKAQHTGKYEDRQRTITRLEENI